MVNKGKACASHKSIKDIAHIWKKAIGHKGPSRVPYEACTKTFKGSQKKKVFKSDQTKVELFGMNASTSLKQPHPTPM